MRELRATLAALTACGALLLAGVAPPAERGAGVVATDHALASAAGAEVLSLGGNAVDAAVAAALAAGVVQPAGSGLGGGGFAVGIAPGGAPWVLDFREAAPAGATERMYRTPDGGVHATASREGPLAVAVPSESRGLAALVARHGNLDTRGVAGPAIRLAGKGFPVGAHLGDSLERSKYDAVRVLFRLGEALARVGDVVRRPELARTLQRWAATRGEDLHTGIGARAIAAATADGVVRASDLAAYQPSDRPIVRVGYRGYTLLTMPPPSSGGVVLGQTLRVLEGYDLAAMGHNSSAYVHIVAEAMKHAYADRAWYLGDPDFVEVPLDRLLSDDRVGEIRRAIWPGRTFPAEHYGALVEPAREAGTQHISVIDAAGGSVALTTTINTSFGSGVVPRGIGIILNNEMDDFSAAPGVPNAYGLVGSTANAIAPGKRPLSSMTPTLVLDPDGNVVMSIGGSGGSTIISAVLQVFLDVVEFDMDPQEAVAAPRFHHQWMPETLWLEPGFPEDVQRALRARGHEIVEREGFSAVQVVVVDDGQRVGGSDPRKGGWPAATR